MKFMLLSLYCLRKPNIILLTCMKPIFSITMMKCLLISPLNCIWNINFVLYSFLKYRDFKFFVISILVVVKEHIVYSKCSSCNHVIFWSFFCVLIRAISERVSQSCNIYNASPFLFCSFESINLSINLSIYQSIYLSTYWQLYEVICPTFLKAVLSAKTVPFIKIGYYEIQIQTKSLCELYWVV